MSMPGLLQFYKLGDAFPTNEESKTVYRGPSYEAHTQAETSTQVSMLAGQWLIHRIAIDRHCRMAAAKLLTQRPIVNLYFLVTTKPEPIWKICDRYTLAIWIRHENARNTIFTVDYNCRQKHTCYREFNTLMIGFKSDIRLNSNTALLCIAYK